MRKIINLSAFSGIEVLEVAANIVGGFDVIGALEKSFLPKDTKN